MSKVGNIILGMVFGATTLSMNSCKEVPAPKYPETEKLISSYGTNPKTISSTWREGTIGRADAQSSLDSTAFRNIFNSTNLVKDSAKIKEFNEIASKNRLPKYIKNDHAAHFYLDRKIRAGINTVDECNKVKSYLGSGFGNSEDSLILAKKQYVIDSMSYYKFFKKHGINDSTLNEKLIKTVQKIRP